MKEEMDGEVRTHAKIEKCRHNFSWRNEIKRDHLRNLGTDGNNIKMDL
jgi:hypothetical protein